MFGTYSELKPASSLHPHFPPTVETPSAALPLWPRKNPQASPHITESELSALVYNSQIGS